MCLNSVLYKLWKVKYVFSHYTTRMFVLSHGTCPNSGIINYPFVHKAVFILPESKITMIIIIRFQCTSLLSEFIFIHSFGILLIFLVPVSPAGPSVLSFYGHFSGINLHKYSQGACSFT